jgi:aryl-alcohol dehydrogenase-like predicted oxidoreductase
MNAGQRVDELLDSAVELGINTFDTARVYGESEGSLGGWIKARGNREQIVLLSKGGHPVISFDSGRPEVTRRRITREEIRSDLETSLLKLGVDELDIYLLHRDDPRVPVGEISEWMDELVREGKVRAIGGSNWTHQRIAAQREYARQHHLTPFTVSSPHFSLAALGTDLYGDGCVTLTGKENAPARSWYRENQLAVISYASLSKGFFGGKLRGDDYDRRAELLDPLSLAAFGSEENFARLKRAEQLAREKGCTLSQLALAYCFTRGMNLFAAAGSTHPERVRENYGALRIALTKEESDWLVGSSE